MDLAVRALNPATGMRFTISGGHPPSCSTDTGVFPGQWSSRGMRLVTHRHAERSFRMSGAKRLLPLHAFIARKETDFNFIFIWPNFFNAAIDKSISIKLVVRWLVYNWLVGIWKETVSREFHVLSFYLTLWRRNYFF